jgi:NitT/TauT family transport system ATP-binding protein
VRLFKNHVAVEQDYYRRTGIHPIMHMVGVRRSLLEKNPWLAASLTKAFERARAVCLAEIDGTGGAAMATLPWMTDYVEETRALMGDDFWPYGFARNETALRTAARWSHEQGLDAPAARPGRSVCQIDLERKPHLMSRVSGGAVAMNIANRALSPVAVVEDASMAGMLLEVRGLKKVFSRQGKEVVALENFDLTVGEGEFVAIVGPSGCGKSTFLHMLGGFEPANGGTMRLNGELVSGPGPDRGMLFQEYALYPWRTVVGNILWPLEIQKVPKAERQKTVERLIAMVGLTQFRNHYPNELSGGMKQRVALARLLALNPRILLMDEPFGALDAQNRELLQEELQQIWNTSRKTVLFVTHDIDESIYLADRVIVFTARPGRIKADIKINLPRPRAIEIKKAPEYTAYRNEIWDLLRGEVLRARDEYR